MPFDPQLDRKRLRLSAAARDALRKDTRRIVIVGARGWIGRTTLALLHEALPPHDFADRVVCFGSSDGDIELTETLAVPQRALSALSDLPAHPTLLFHLAFLTKDKVGDMPETVYIAENRRLSATVHSALDSIGVDRLFVASSGAATFADDPSAAGDLRLYGRLKREDEDLFAAWAKTEPARRRAAIGRIYNVSGPFMNKHDAYALASFIIDALAGLPIEVRAPMRVLRGHIPVRELVSFVLATLLNDDVSPELRFETGGEAMELAELADIVGKLLDARVVRRPITDPRDNRYMGDENAWRRLLASVGMEPLPLVEQVAETAAYLSRQGGVKFASAG